MSTVLAPSEPDVRVADAPSRALPAPPLPGRPRVVVLGGGFGGLFAARALGSVPVSVTVVDRKNHHLFQPLLYQVATAGLSPGDIASPIRFILRRLKNVQVLLAEARAIDPARRVVTLDVGELPYDFLVVATGATHAYFGHDDWREFAPGLKTLDDALNIRRQVLLAFERAERTTDADEQRRLLTFVIVGGGPTGVELAGAVAEMARHALRSEFDAIHPERARVILMEGGPNVLETFPEKLRQHGIEALRSLGVDVRTNSHVTRIAAGEVEVKDGTRIEAGTILWAAGVAASPLGRSLGAPLDRAGRVTVQPDLTVAGHPEVSVVGDLARFEQDGAPLPGVAPVAMQQAEHAARNIARAVEGKPLLPFRYTNYGNLATIGRNEAIADFGRVKVTGLVAWVLWLFIHILKLTGFRNRLVVLVQWAFAYFTYQRSIRLITGDEWHSSASQRPS